MILEMLSGGGLVLIGLAIGRFAPARRRTPKPPKPICGCRHQMAFHDPATGQCHGLNTVDAYNRFEDSVGEKQVECTCRQYDGPTPLPVIYAPEIKP